jgi:murein DD-endopeptidase MepM/ murein hydrolase activator NlpD
MLLFRTLALFSLTLCLAAYGAKIDEKINKTSTQLNQTKQTYSQLNAKLEMTAKKIVQQREVVNVQQEHLNSLVTELKSKETVYHQNKLNLNGLAVQQDQLVKTQEEIEKRLVTAIARNMSLSLLIQDDRAKNADAIITEEAIKLHLKQINTDIRELNGIYSQNVEKITDLSRQTTVLKQSIAVIDQQKQTVQATEQQNEKAIVQLEKEKSEYKRSLGKILAQQRSLQNTLASLNIIKREEMEPKQAPPPLAPQKVGSKPLPEGAREAISAYQPSKTAAYSGARTIAPLDGYVVTKRFGPYTDPVYGIKIYNESVSLRPTSSDMVKAIFNGKVILAKPTAMLENVVIIEHDNGLHTIYAHLDKIAPTVSVGQRLKEGTVIGRVERELMFQVTQRNAHIDPLQVIQ